MPEAHNFNSSESEDSCTSKGENEVVGVEGGREKGDTKGSNEQDPKMCGSREAAVNSSLFGIPPLYWHRSGGLLRRHSSS